MPTKTNIRFKELTAHQVVLFPTSIGDKIKSNHPVRIVNQIVDQLNIDDIISSYKGGGTSSFHPRMMVKVLFYSYFCNIYSCRKIAQALQENIHFMWISGNSTPDFRTINDFRGKRLKDKIQKLFAEMVRLMSELGYVSLDIQYVDGTKIESASNKYTFVWKGSVEKNKAKLEQKIAGVLSSISESIKEDKEGYKKEEVVKEVSASELNEKIKELNEKLSGLSKKQKKEVKKLEDEDLPRLKKYEQQLEQLGDRNSYSKTDPDATFMRMKDDHMKNGQLKPAYNFQISTENQFITNYTIHQRPGDTATLISHLEQFRRHYQKQSTRVVADAGYGSEQNYEYMEESSVEAFVKYNYFHKEQKRKFKNDIFHASNLFYNADHDYFICPMGQKMTKVGEHIKRSDLGYLAQVSVYQAQRCDGCPLRGMCHKSNINRKIEVNHKLRRYKAKARERLLSEEGIRLRGQRAIEPEAVFGQLKSNNRFNRLKLRSLRKVDIDLGLTSIAHNLRKMAKKVAKNLLNTVLNRYLKRLLKYTKNLKPLTRREVRVIKIHGYNNPIRLLVAA